MDMTKDPYGANQELLSEWYAEGCPTGESREPVMPDYDEAICPKCGREMDWEECWNCDEYGFSHHDCGEDSCCCLYPENNVVCDICDGKGGWYRCFHCHPEEQIGD